jgi:hypothetical protein
MTITEQDALKQKKTLSPSTNPRKEAIKALGKTIEDLQCKDHAIILMIDANQTPQESIDKKKLNNIASNGYV